jgi:outer membrane protein TolC
LVDCILYTLKNNSEILIKRVEPQLRQADVAIANSDFEPVFTAQANLQDSTKISSSSLSGAGLSKSRELDLNAGVSGKFITGTEYSVDFNNTRYKSNSALQIINPYYETEPKITLTQPLFKDLGTKVNRAEILIARNNLLESQQGFEDKVMDTITAAITAYYKYIFYLESYSIEKLSLDRAQDLFEINKTRYGKGLLSSVDLLETEAASATRQKLLLAAETALKRAEDDLKLVTNLIDDPEVWNARIELVDKPEFKSEDTDLLKSLENSFKYRPDYLAAKIDLGNRDIKVITSKNSRLPSVDLIGSFGLNGLDKDFQSALEKANLDHTDWSLGVKFSMPWGSGDRAKYDQRQLEKAQALLTFKRLEQNIILEVRDKVRLAKTNYRQVEVAIIAREKEDKNYQAQKERYAAGQVSTHDILDYQDKLAQAELDYIKALVDYNISLVNLDKSQGLTLVKNNIRLEE